MPTVLVILGLRFFFYSSEHKPMHVHVEKEDKTAKFTINPEVALIENNGLKPADLRKAKQIIEDNREYIVNFWKATFEEQ